MLILSAHYLPCIAWFRLFLEHEHAVLDIHEHFVKQSYRSRTLILGANGKQALTIPVKKTAHKMPMNSVEIEYSSRWQHQHWQAIMSAYNSSPYFLYYQDHFKPLYEKEFRYLVEFNQALLQACLKIMKISRQIDISEAYIHPGEQDMDMRTLISPKKETDHPGKHYLQVFTEKYPFEPNLSILDLLFNQGPRWTEYI